MRNLYTRHANTLPAHARDAIASLFGRDALDSRVCDLMSLSEWDGIYDESAPAHASDCYTCSGDSPAYRADHEYARVCDVIGHRYGTASEDHLCYGCGAQATDPAMIDPLWHEYQERAYRAADFFDQTRAARDDIAAGTYVFEGDTFESSWYAMNGGTR